MPDIPSEATSRGMPIGQNLNTKKPIKPPIMAPIAAFLFNVPLVKKHINNGINKQLTGSS